ncbi:alpha-(1-_3)-arabinofuranosyltransferase family protein [Spongisporangium articulatum]|uniref:Alpha-(1->3)-arabinofuranosyltransferase family protein n=1 Tax=Spongisporangium articulatum TaxID=3362603 RepID=A0ABW8ATP1_9ACTN
MSPSAQPSTQPLTQRQRLHLLAVSVALTALAFVQAPGQIAPDTKADLSIDPLGFLLRAGHLWEPLGDSGQLQNQAYGYFLPMGPFYVAGHLLGFPAWMVQRAWWAVVLLVAFHGLYRLCRRLDIGTHPIQIIAALTFALSPRMITEVGPVSIEAWPMAMAPWVLAPLVKVRRGGEVTAAARSGLMIALCGGVNAVAVGAVLPLPVWWLMTREKGPVRRSLARWWSLAAVLATFWWVGPLLLLGRYSPPFLDWVESSAVSTSKGSLTGAFRGTTQWVAWLAVPEPLWRSGFAVITSPGGVLLTWVLLVISLVGMFRPDTPHRRFLVGGCIGGLALLTLGHTGPFTAPWSAAVQTFLDNGGAPLRNTHKFDLVLRVPMALALAHALSKVNIPAVRISGLPSIPRGPRIAQFIAVCALVGSAAPALAGQLPAQGSFTGVPNYWRQAAAWLETHQAQDGGRTLIVPGSSFATSIWGDPHDEPFQALARTSWATRSSVPLSSAGNIRVLNTIEEQLETGRGSPGLAEYLARAGISRILLRSDLQRSFTPGSPPLPVTVRSALKASPGLKPVARFGPQLQGTRNIFQVADDGLDVAQSAIEIWDVTPSARLADVLPASGAVKVQGGPEALLALADADQLDDRPVVLEGDPLAPQLQDAPLVATDGVQRREANFAQVRDNYSLVMTADQPYVNKRKVHDWLPFDTTEVTARYSGISGVSTSTEAGTTTGGWYALDGDSSTAWTSGRFAVDQWISVTFPDRVGFTQPLQVTFSSTGARVSAVEVITDSGAETSTLNPEGAGTAQSVRIPAGATRTLKLRIAGVPEGGNDELLPVSLSALRLPGITPTRTYVMPRTTGTPSVISLRSARDGVDGCMFTDNDALCSPRLVQQSQDSDIDRTVTLPATADYAAVGTARLKATAQLDDLLVPSQNAMTATASSRRTLEPAGRPQAAVDRDPSTAWIAGINDLTPTLTISWPGKRVVDRLRWQVSPVLAASKPASLEVRIGNRSTTVEPDDDGWISFPRATTDRITLIVRGVIGLQSLDRVSGFPVNLPVGASEIVVPGSADTTRIPLPAYRTVQLSCGSGPALDVNGQSIQTRLTGTTDQVLRRAPMTVRLCSAMPALRAGENRIVLQESDTVTPESLTMVPASTGARLPQTTAAPTPVVDDLSQEHRTVQVTPGSGAQILVVHENFNAGWRAELKGRQLETIRLDGWQQGYVVPAGQGGTVDLRFTPGRPYRLILITGMLMVALLAAMAFPRRRRRPAPGSPDGRAVAAVQPPGGRAAARRARRALSVTLEEAPGRFTDGLLAAGALVFMTGLWGVGVALGTLVLLRRYPVRALVIGVGGVTGLTAALSARSVETAFLSQVAIFGALVLLAVLVLVLDDGGAGPLARIGSVVGRFVPARRPRTVPRVRLLPGAGRRTPEPPPTETSEEGLLPQDPPGAEPDPEGR